MRISRHRSSVRLLVALALAATTPSCRSSTSDAGPEPDLVATGRCLGPLCLGMAETEALEAIEAPPMTSKATRRCFHLEDADLDLSFDVDDSDPRRSIRSILVTNLAHCSASGGATPVGVAWRIADCRGLRPGDPESFAGKLHRQAAPIASHTNPWTDAPSSVRGLEDVCEPAAAAAARSGIYLRQGWVVGLAVWRP